LPAFAATRLFAAEAAPVAVPPPDDWIDPQTGHCVIGFLSNAGGASPCFTTMPSRSTANGSSSAAIFTAALPAAAAAAAARAPTPSSSRNRQRGVES